MASQYNQCISVTDNTLPPNFRLALKDDYSLGGAVGGRRRDQIPCLQVGKNPAGKPTSSQETATLRQRPD